MDEIKATLDMRGETYGQFKENARITQMLCDVLETAPNYNKLSHVHIEAYHMIFHKISRAVCGNPWNTDSTHDIIGYATLLEKHIHREGVKKLLDKVQISDERSVHREEGL